MRALNKMSVKVDLVDTENGDTIDAILDAVEAGLGATNSEFPDPLETFYTLRFDRSHTMSLSATVTAQSKKGGE